jgi:UDP:flavonoid glycosyltransferase YjiC (YdhE family)
VLSTGKSFDPESIACNAFHVTIVREAPQISLLKRSALMITHAGSTTVRECLTLGVPVLLYPLMFDQFGIAARAVFHGLGLQGDISTVSAAGMEQLMRKLLTVPYFAMQARHMSREFERAEKENSAWKAIESFLPGDWPAPVPLQESEFPGALDVGRPFMTEPEIPVS